MILQIEKELIGIALEGADLKDVEVEQEFEGPVVFRRLQRKFDEILNSNGSLKKYMKTKGYTSFETSGYGLELRGGMFVLSQSFTLFDDDGMKNEDMRLNISFDMNLIVEKLSILKGVWGDDYIFKM